MVPPASDKIPRVSSYSGDANDSACLPVREFHPLCLCFPSHSSSLTFCISRSYNPALLRFGLFPFRSPLLGKSLLFSFPPATEMFQFTGLLFISKYEWLDLNPAGFPHSDIHGSSLFWQLPMTFRSLIRPSSFKSGQASSVRPSLLDLISKYACFEIVLHYKNCLLFSDLVNLFFLLS